ncbi:MAG: hypothetical protein K0Q49_1716 [Haloplasmataceae bacterium]|nr:hypothetical protein [Haloplasmataceae bacterium]
MNFLKNVFKSIFIGAGAVAPGVSGGALAIVFGLYEKIIYAINNVFKDFKKHVFFLLSIGIGAGIGVVLFASIQLALIDRFPMQTMFTFLGLVVGTIPTLFYTAIKKGYSHKLWIPFFITLAIGILFSLLDNPSIKDNIEQTEVIINVRNISFLFVVGFIMAGSLVIPGISGTVLLLLLGVYGLVMNAITDVKGVLELPFGSKEMIYAIMEKMYILIPLGLGLAVGALIFSKLMEYLLEHKYSITFFAIIGFVVGSLPELVLGLDFNTGAKTIILSIIFFLIASLSSFYINKLAKE